MLAFMTCARGNGSCAHAVCTIATTPHTLLGSALSLLLVFRTNASYSRLVEGRRVCLAIPLPRCSLLPRHLTPWDPPSRPRPVRMHPLLQSLDAFGALRRQQIITAIMSRIRLLLLQMWGQLVRNAREWIRMTAVYFPKELHAESLAYVQVQLPQIPETVCSTLDEEDWQCSLGLSARSADGQLCWTV